MHFFPSVLLSQRHFETKVQFWFSGDFIQILTTLFTFKKFVSSCSIDYNMYPEPIAFILELLFTTASII